MPQGAWQAPGREAAGAAKTGGVLPTGAQVHLALTRSLLFYKRSLSTYLVPCMVHTTLSQTGSPLSPHLGTSPGSASPAGCRLTLQPGSAPLHPGFFPSQCCPWCPLLKPFNGHPTLPFFLSGAWRAAVRGGHSMVPHFPAALLGLDKNKGTHYPPALPLSSYPSTDRSRPEPWGSSKDQGRRPLKQIISL